MLSSVKLLRNYTGLFGFQLKLQNLKTNYSTCSSSSLCKGIFLNLKKHGNCRSMSTSNRQPKETVTMTFVKADGTEIKRQMRIGGSIKDMIALRDPEIIGYGMCGGTGTCGTCHIIFSKEDFNKLNPMSDAEEELLGFAPEKCDTSRLGCKVIITEEMDGFVMKLPSTTLSIYKKSSKKGLKKK